MPKKNNSSILIPLLFFVIPMAPNLYKSVINRVDQKPVVYTIKTGESISEIESHYSWSFTKSSFRNMTIDLNILIDHSALERVSKTYEELKEKTVDDLNITVFYDENPDLFQQQKWGSIYSYLNIHADPELQLVADGFLSIAEEYKLNDQDLLNMIIIFVQSIEYQIPENRLGLLAPLQTLAEEYADCDTASLLLYTLLDKIGYRVGIYYSRAYRHAMLGINMNATGYYKEHNLLRYYFLEVTNKGWQLGQIAADMTDLEKWFFIDLKERLPLL